MLGLRYLLRPNIRQSSLLVQLKQFSLSSTARNSSDDEDNRTDRRPKRKSDEKEKKAINKLNALLSAMVEEDKTLAATKMQAVLSRPKRMVKKLVPDGRPGVESKVEAAARSAAASLGGDVAKTESDLLARLRSQAASERRVAEPELVLERSEESRIKTARSLTSLLSGMQIEKKSTRKTKDIDEEKEPWIERRGGEGGAWRGERRGERRGEADSYDRRPRMQPERVVLFGKESLNIFKTDFVSVVMATEMSTWQRCLERELRLASTQPPANHFQEMIQWTNQGKLWHFPIDNEQDMADEKDTSFTHHVFFESHLESWCTCTEVRHFMDLVCVGLSKNPYISADDKLSHIEWFRQYFTDKTHLLDGAGQQPAQESISQ